MTTYLIRSTRSRMYLACYDYARKTLDSPWYWVSEQKDAWKFPYLTEANLYALRNYIQFYEVIPVSVKATQSEYSI